MIIYRCKLFTFFLFYRLDFERFSIAGPEPVNHQCDNDQFIISGSNPIPVICGMNTGGHSTQIYSCYNAHKSYFIWRQNCTKISTKYLYFILVYVDAGTGSSPIILTMVTSGIFFKRNWKIKVSQIPCESTTKGKFYKKISYVLIYFRMYIFDYNIINRIKYSWHGMLAILYWSVGYREIVQLRTLFWPSFVKSRLHDMFEDGTEFLLRTIFSLWWSKWAI